MSSDAYVPLIDLTAAREGDVEQRRATAQAIDAALKRSGFFVISGHGVPQATVEAALEALQHFFALPLERKMQARSSAKGSPRGYIPFGLETLALTEGRKAPPDLKEGFGMGPYWIEADIAAGRQPPASYTRNVWPQDPPGFRATIEAYYQAMERLTELLMALFALGMRLEPGFFVERFRNHNSTLRLIHYPPQSEPPAPGQLRAGAHTDYGALTILLAQNRDGGLEVRLPDGRWTAVTAPPGSFVINIGDLMMNWSNDTWLSNSHRVANPGQAVGEASRRYSLAYFCNPNDDLLIECLPTCRSAERPAKYRPIPAGEHRLRKIEASKQGAAANTPS